ncbi:UNVERIFIED_CONTAM: hypothetical protein NCL1_22943 [Trichonephila clavipes]
MRSRMATGVSRSSSATTHIAEPPTGRSSEGEGSLPDLKLVLVENGRCNARPDLLQLMIEAEIDDLSTVSTDDLTATGDTDTSEKRSKSNFLSFCIFLIFTVMF